LSGDASMYVLQSHGPVNGTQELKQGGVDQPTRLEHSTLRSSAKLLGNGIQEI